MKNFKTYGQFIAEAYSDEERRELADKGFALSDGSFPIKDLKDLKNAIQAYGRAKDQARAAKFIVKRAKALGAEDLIPDTEDFQKSLDESKLTEAKVKVTKKDIKDIEDSGNIDIAYKKAMALLKSLSESVVTEKLTRGLKPLLTIGSTISKTAGEDALLKLSDDFDALDDEDSDSIASHLNMAIELMQDGYSGDATKKLKQFNKACKDVLNGKKVGSAFESVNEAQKVNSTSKKFLKGMKKIKVKELGGYMPGVDYVYVDGNKYYFVDFEGDYMELKNTNTIKQLHKLHGSSLGESVNEAFKFSEKEVKDIAELIAKAIAKVDNMPTAVHDIEFDKGRGAGFEISMGGDRHEGGSYTVRPNGDVVNSAIGNSFPNAIYAKIGDKDINKVMKNIQKFESTAYTQVPAKTIAITEGTDLGGWNQGGPKGNQNVLITQYVGPKDIEDLGMGRKCIQINVGRDYVQLNPADIIELQDILKSYKVK